MSLKNNQDIEANYFARCLLMPKTLIIQELEIAKKRGVHQSNTISILAEKFKVENEAMRFRLQELKLMDYGL